MQPPSLSRYEVPPQFDAHPPVYVAASAGRSGKSWYETTQRWFSVQRPPLDMSDHVQLPPLQPMHMSITGVAYPTERVSRGSSIADNVSQPVSVPRYGTHLAEVPHASYYAPKPRPALHHVPPSTQRPQASTAATFWAHRSPKHPRPDAEDELAHAAHDTCHSCHSPSLSTLPSNSDAPTMPARKKPRYADAISVRGGCALPTLDTSLAGARSMTAFTTLLQPPTRIEAMASLTHFALDSARAISTINNLASRRKALAESLSVSSAPISRASSSCSSMEARSSPEEKTMRLKPNSVAPVKLYTPLQKPEVPWSEWCRSDLPVGRAAVVGVSEPSNPSTSPEPTDQSSLRSIPLLKYVVTTSAEVQASISSVGHGLSSSLFYAGGKALYRDCGQPDYRSRYKRRVPESAHEEAYTKKSHKPPRLLPLLDKPQSLTLRARTAAMEAVCPEPDSDEFKDDRPSKESVAQLAVGAGPMYKMNKMQCMWPGCPFYDYPGELWLHIKDTHRADAGRPKPSGNPVVMCNWAPPGEPRGNRCTYRERASRMWDHFMAKHHKDSVKPGGEIMCRLGQCTSRSKNLDFQRHLEDVHWKLEGTVRWCEGCGVWKRFDKGRLLHHFHNCLRKWMDCDPGFRQGLDLHEM